MSNLLIRGGSVVDGTGAKPFRADVRVKNGIISEVAKDLKPAGERVIDAGGAFVTPGFIDCHTHYDGPMWWNPTLDPLPSHGTTTAIMGLCGFSAAPMSKNLSDRRDMIGVFSFIEDIPQKTFENNVPWDQWATWSEYATAMKKFPMPTNIGALVGHINLRIFVMGAAAWERVATPAENAQMAAVLDDAMRSGALGLSTNFFDSDIKGRPVPTLISDDAEFEAITNVLAKYPGAVLEFAINVVNERHMAVPQIERMVKFCKPRGIRMQFLFVQMEYQNADFREELLAAQRRLRADGADLWSIYLARPLTLSLSFEANFIFKYQHAWAWDDLVNNTPTWEEKAKKLADPSWRAKARDEIDHHLTPQSNMDKPETLIMKQSETDVGPFGMTLAEYSKSKGMHQSDALADWLLANGAEASLGMVPQEIDDDAMIRTMRDPYSVSGANDAGAHGKLFCGAAETAYLLTKFVRDQGKLSIEETVHYLTGKVADHYSLGGRGVIALGNIADLAVFALDEIEFRPEIKARDVPTGDGGITWRYTRAPAPFRATIVGGTPTFEMDKGYTGATPGQLIGLDPVKGAASRAAD
jgi:N-acyl-D-amino-acid deacylase